MTTETGPVRVSAGLENLIGRQLVTDDFAAMLPEQLRVAGVRQARRGDRIEFSSLTTRQGRPSPPTSRNSVGFRSCERG